MAQCPTCNAAIMWVPLGGKHYPLNIARVPGGNIEFDGTARVVEPHPLLMRFVAHASTCPGADQYGRPVGVRRPRKPVPDPAQGQLVEA